MLRATFVLLAPLSLLHGQAPQPAAEATVALEGQVIDLRGEPVPKAKVHVVTRQEPDRVLAQTMCDGEGFFRLGHVQRRASWLLRADSPGHCRGEAGVAGEPKPVRIEVHDAATVRGVLRNKGGTPVAGAIVRARLVGRMLRTEVDATSDAEGHFTLAGVPLGLVCFAAVVPGEGIAEVRNLLVQGDADVALAPVPRAVTTLQIAVEGMPEDKIDQLGIQILPQGSPVLALPPPWDRPRCRANGTLELQQFPDCQCNVTPHAPGFVFAPRSILSKPVQGPRVLKFTASAVGSAAVLCPALVRDGEGKPMNGLRLTMRMFSGAETAEATSNQDGKLTFAIPLAAGTEVVVRSLDERFVLDQQKAAGSRATYDSRLLVDHECKVDPAATLQLRAIAACSVKGRVLLADGRPAAFVNVGLEEFCADRGPQWMAFANATTDRQGNYAFQGRHHLDRPVRVSVQSWAGAGASENQALAEPGTALAVPDLKLGEPAVVEGTVVDAANKPAPGIRVWLRDWDFAIGHEKSGHVVEVITDRQGRFRFAAVPPGGAWLQMLVDQDFTSERAVQPFAVESGRSYAIELQLPKQR